mmetsp:Transcript_34487/g.67494  ORF Transcript_34487/g.67494 Transcript_34487/m.67494 type:complete len:814 (+) Transcript_34487:117-2558(+)|eukprot:CAMPEP_0173412920 /NCGR_PEP_ID=MMETSP1356-20130122/80659_1 /TAXON_ID=77927 ORGANISM="Hemiselmis virescens, Strain PCC157" /NCGR_SAMPLE_ID=MMETSP1356 /ASSEMBLY_ACC=CAM_ASM_000847 /LENGTH=813 /DNA_ID=CAMNT_0014374877 /DNA_START=30 /DNA_END=2471 /DNA_ORIENTATION=+
MATSLGGLIRATQSFHRPPGAGGGLKRAGTMKAGASPKLASFDGKPPLHSGVSNTSFGNLDGAGGVTFDGHSSLSELPEVDTVERDPENCTPDDEELMHACEQGDVRMVKSVLRRTGIHINMVDEGGMTALIKAVRYGHPKIVHILLAAGADVNVVDKHYRTAWYFAAFSSTAPVGRHWRCMLELCSAVFEDDFTPEIVLTACYSNQARVLNVLLEHFRRNIPSRDSQNWCKLEFFDLHKLDDFSVQMTWPDGSKSPAGQTALYALIDKEKKRALVHPTIRGLLVWKWNKFGRMMFYTELLMHTVSVACLSGSAATLRFGELETRDLSSRAGNLVIQGISLLVGILFFCRDMFDMYNRHQRKQKARFIRHVGSLAAFVLNLTVMVLYVIDSAEVQSRVDTAAAAGFQEHQVLVVSETRKWFFRVFALTIVWIWMRFFNYLELVDWIGSFFIMVERIIREDLTRWAIVILVTMPGFSLAFNLIFDIVLYEYEMDPNSTEAILAETSHLRNTYIGWHNAIFGQFLVMFSLDSWPRGQNEPISAILLVGFVVMLNLISVNLLIAMMASTYEAVKDDALPEWNFRQARFIMERSYLLSQDFIQYKQEYSPYKFQGYYHRIFPNLKEDHEHGELHDSMEGREPVSTELFEEAQLANMAKFETLRTLMYQVQENQDTLRALLTQQMNPSLFPPSTAVSPQMPSSVPPAGKRAPGSSILKAAASSLSAPAIPVVVNSNNKSDRSAKSDNSQGTTEESLEKYMIQLVPPEEEEASPSLSVADTNARGTGNNGTAGAGVEGNAAGSGILNVRGSFVLPGGAD